MRNRILVRLAVQRGPAHKGGHFEFHRPTRCYAIDTLHVQVHAARIFIRYAHIQGVLCPKAPAGAFV